jgi:hypothetical protein
MRARKVLRPRKVVVVGVRRNDGGHTARRLARGRQRFGRRAPEGVGAEDHPRDRLLLRRELAHLRLSPGAEPRIDQDVALWPMDQDTGHRGMPDLERCASRAHGAGRLSGRELDPTHGLGCRLRQRWLGPRGGRRDCEREQGGAD